MATLRTRVKAGPLAGLVLSVVLGAVLALTQLSDVLIPQLRLREGAPAPKVARVSGANWQGTSPTEVGSPAGSATTHATRIARGTVIDESNPTHQAALAFETSRLPTRLRIGVVFALHAALLWLMTAYLRRFGPGRARLLRTQFGLFSLVALFVVLTKAALVFLPLSELVAPLAIVPLFCAHAVSRRAAFFLGVLLAFMTTIVVSADASTFVVFVSSTVASTLLVPSRRHGSRPFAAGVGGALAATAAWAGLALLTRDLDFVLQDLRSGIQSSLLAAAGGALVAGLVGELLSPFGIRAMGGVSRSRLLNLSDLDQPLLVKMASDAPGSWEHARAMANLAEAASSTIGADALLTRVGAYYHDLGKTIQPRCFIENLPAGEKSPHDALDPDVSAELIVDHVVEGVKLLRDGGIPEPVVEFAYTHHGTQLVEYFWHKCQAAGNPKALDETHFRYPGMRPQTKETGILMLVDAIEAASRTIVPPERKKFEEMVRRVVFTKVASGQLDESGLTIMDLKLVIAKVTDTLVNMSHGRIRYPWQDEQRASTGKTDAAKQPRHVELPMQSDHPPAKSEAPEPPAVGGNGTRDLSASTSSAPPPAERAEGEAPQPFDDTTDPGLGPRP